LVVDSSTDSPDVCLLPLNVALFLEEDEEIGSGGGGGFRLDWEGL
jgi:hypothetical protein